MDSKAIRKEFEAKGYDLGKFARSDTERIGGDAVYQWYAADTGIIVAKFVDLANAAEWIEFRRMDRV